MSSVCFVYAGFSQTFFKLTTIKLTFMLLGKGSHSKYLPTEYFSYELYLEISLLLNLLLRKTTQAVKMSQLTGYDCCWNGFLIRTGSTEKLSNDMCLYTCPQSLLCISYKRDFENLILNCRSSLKEFGLQQTFQIWSCATMSTAGSQE